VWIATGSPFDTRSGLTFASEDLQEWSWLEPPVAGVMRGAAANDLVVRGRSAWLATDRGLARLDIRNAADVRLWSATTGLPADDALSVAPRDDGTWVGTSRGIVFVRDSIGDRRGTQTVSGPTIASGTAVRALMLTGDTLWIGSDAGLLLLPPGSTDAVRAAAAGAEPRLSRPIRAIARSDTVVAIAIADDVLRITIPGGRLLPRLTAVDFRVVGGITTMAIDASTIWVGGPNGVLVTSRATNVSMFLPAVAGVRARVRDILLSPEHGWVATESGVVRLIRMPDGMVR
jgi:ligand-binding sensor domain-containing protein